MPSLSKVSALLVHTNFVGETQPDSSADAQSGESSGQFVIDDSDGSLYVYSPIGASFSLQTACHKFDIGTGTYLGLVGNFSLAGQGSQRPGGGMYIMHHPTRGKWLVNSSGGPWNSEFQLMALDAFDGAGNTITRGTLTNRIVPFGGFTGLAGAIDVDRAGNVWICGHGHLGPNVLNQYVFTGDTTIGLAASTDLGTLFGWINAYAVKFEPSSGNLMLWGSDAGSNLIIARVDQNNAFNILASSIVAQVAAVDVPQNIGADGRFVSRWSSTNTFSIVDAVSCTLVQNVSMLTTYGVTAALWSIWYDSANQFVWISFNGPNSVGVFDLNNQTPSGFVMLKDPTVGTYLGDDGSHDIVTQYGFHAATANGFYGVTIGTCVDLTSTRQAYIDIWGSAAPMIIIGHALNLLSSRYQT